ncbi:hypothetical protein [Buttiauxella noackiae]|uniref:hypothetical protein n=1 Tax=Buttiauxella noackiae TaxID=82992 RepID=UPI000690BC37|nr:hypothetical protein [Buttiauxella noackiae]
MSQTRFYFNLSLFGATSSIAAMRMLSEQTECSILRAITDPQIQESEFENERETEQGEVYSYTEKVYSCGSCVGYDQNDVKDEYVILIAQLMRRSAFLTIFGLFEYHMSNCLSIMITESNYIKKLSEGVIENTHEVLKKGIGRKDISDLNHLTVIRNILAHNDGRYYEYVSVANKPDIDRKRKERRKFLAVERALKGGTGVSINDLSELILDAGFLTQAVNEIEEYTRKLSDAVTHYANNKTLTTP